MFDSTTEVFCTRIGFRLKGWGTITLFPHHQLDFELDRYLAYVRHNCLHVISTFKCVSSTLSFEGTEYIIGQKLVGQIFRLTKFFFGQNSCHQAEMFSVLSDFCLTFVLTYWTNVLSERRIFVNVSDEFLSDNVQQL